MAGYGKTVVSFCLGIAVQGCTSSTKPVSAVAPHAQTAPSNGAKREEGACQNAKTLSQRAHQFAEKHRPLRAQLYLDRAKALCPKLADELQPASVAPTSEALEEVYRWLASTDPRLALSPERFTDERIARQLDTAVLTLSQREPVETSFFRVYDPIPAAGISEPWVALTANSLSRQGEWFERYAELPGDLLLGPFHDRIMLLNRGVFEDRSCLVFDLTTGEILAQRPMPALSAGDYSWPAPVALDANHFAIPVVSRPAELEQTTPRSSRIEIWSAVPLQRVAEFPAPSYESVARSTLTVVRDIPGLPRGQLKLPPPPPPGCVPHPGSVSLSARIAAMAQGFPKQELEGPRQKPLEPRRLYLLRGDWLAVVWGNVIDVVDWRRGQSISTLPNANGWSSENSVTLSPDGRYFSFRPSPDSIGFFELSTRKSWVVLAPGRFDDRGGVFSPDSRHFAIGGNAGVAYLFETSTRRLARTFAMPGSEKPAHSKGARRPSSGCPESPERVTEVGFIRGGKELVVTRERTAQLHRFSTQTGKLLELGSLAPNNGLYPTSYASRADGSVAFIADTGCVTHELLERGLVTHPHCGVRGKQFATSPSGEQLLRVQAGKDGASREAVLVATRGGKPEFAWTAPRTDYPNCRPRFLPNQPFAVAPYAPVVDIVQLREVWPSRGMLWEGALSKEETYSRFLPHGELSDRIRSALARTSQSPRSRDEASEALRATSIALGELRVSCARTASTHFYRGEQWLAGRAGCAKPIFMDAKRPRVLLQVGEEFLWWFPLENREEPLALPKSADGTATAARVEEQSLILVRRRRDAIRHPLSPHRLGLFDMKSNRLLWEVDVEEKPSKTTLVGSPSRRILAATMRGLLLAWDAVTGKEVVRWEGVDDIVPIPDTNLVLLKDGMGIEFAQLDPPRRLIKVLASRDSAFAVAQDGRIELLGDRTNPPRDVRCRIGHRVLPFSACAERLEWPGLLTEVLSQSASMVSR